MSRLRTRLIVAIVVVPLTSLACAGAGGPAQDQLAPPTAVGADAAHLARLEALFRARADSALMNVHEADVSFMSGMIHHHAQALVMAGLAPTHGAGPAVGTLTARITNAQKDEINLMQRWLRDRGRPVPEVDASGHITGMAGMTDHSTHMPGMLSPAQLDQLGNAQGGDFDRLFLTFMIQHHTGAVTMVHELFATDGAAQDDFVFKLASDIQVDQTTEVARMQQMLDALAGQSNR